MNKLNSVGQAGRERVRGRERQGASKSRVTDSNGGAPFIYILFCQAKCAADQLPFACVFLEGSAYNFNKTSTPSEYQAEGGWMMSSRWVGRCGQGVVMVRSLSTMACQENSR